jgi:hypothetical protein
MFKRPLILFITCLVFLLSNFKSKAQWSTEDSLKATTYIRYTAEVFEKLKHNQEVRKSILGIAESSADPVYFATIDSVIKNYDSKEINQQISLKDSINFYLSSLGYDIVYDSIVSFFNSKSYYAWWYENEDNLRNGEADSALVTFAPYVTILNKPAFNNTSFLWDIMPLVGYFSFEDSLPISSANPDLSITEEMIWLNKDPYFNWVFGFKFTPLLGAYTTGLITTCSGTVNKAKFPCIECSSSIPQSNLPVIAVGGSGSTEVEIKLRDQNSSKKSECINNLAPVLGVTPQTINNVVDLTEYGILTSKRSVPKYTRVGISCIPPYNYGIKKVSYGIIDRFYEATSVNPLTYSARKGNQLTFCNWRTYFIAGNPTCFSPGLTMGTRFYLECGLFEIKRAFPSRPMYFYYPYAPGIWYDGLPDMTLNYKYEIDTLIGTICNQPGTSIEHKMTLEDCYMCDFGDDVIGPGSYNYIGNNSRKVIEDYWLDNAIDIGFCLNFKKVLPSDYYTFYASNFATPSCPLWSPTTLIQTLNLSFDGVYQTFAPINDVYTIYNAGTVLYIDVVANFKNGEIISEQRCVTLNSTCSYITTQIRGDIKEYDEIVNYEIKIYQ